MPPTIGLVANVYNEINALPGWLEVHTGAFDDVRLYHAGPQGALSDDGTMELLEKWRVPVVVGSIDDGFGAVRTKTLRMCPCDYVVLLDADERMFPLHRAMTCSGEQTPWGEADPILTAYTSGRPDWDDVAKLGAGLHVDIGAPYDQVARLREVLDRERPDALCTVRRHWHDLSFRRPTQDWTKEPDWQMRTVRNHPDIRFSPGTKMHERLEGASRVVYADFERGPFFDHFHFWFKRMEMDQRAHDVAIYNAIHAGRRPPREPR